MPSLSDPYRLLGVPRSASLRQIKAAHRALAKRYHPDSPTADADRFLRVQEAYQLLADPLRRREWDARHAPAPVRADEPGPAATRQRSRRAADSREQQARSYTWSASEVPWWEEGRAQRGRSRRRPASEGIGEPAGEQAARTDFDVYNRSSGAAWSAAARAYFRRADQDLPRRGSFHYQGSQPLTAARARAAQAGAERAREAPRSSRPPPVATPEAGVARDAESIHRVRARVRRQELAGRWPSRFQRTLYAAVGWLPLAFLVGYGGPVVAGCTPTTGGCPDLLAPAQAVAALILLGLLYALPKLAYAAALATTVLAVAAGTLLLAAWVLRLPAPQLASLPPAALSLGFAALAAAYALVGAWLLADRQRRPWAAIRVRR